MDGIEGGRRLGRFRSHDLTQRPDLPLEVVLPALSNEDCPRRGADSDWPFQSPICGRIRLVRLTTRTSGIGALSVSLVVGMTSNLLFLAAFQFRLDWFREP